MPSPHALVQWLSETALSRSFNEAHYLFFGAFMALHLIGIALLVGASLVTDLRVLGLGLRSASPARTIRVLRPWLRAGLLVAALSGIWLLVADPLKYYANPVFRAKAALLLAALLLQAATHRGGLAATATALPARALALAALLAWLATAAAGRIVGLL